ncbi:alpha/beta hydrolase fold domain-containing protein [Qipengyuania flava]|uniref:alpha/beta hydrolase fold domain-containing protein n=1 Tax=Qipengyuania flava TaxID=192812 RepID=UPI001CD3838D|nr:alpha/beta hydrolase [Qipengyuania flava]MCA0891246.1 alpha/beta hydrolase [Qipengyuania flava]
MSITEHGLHPSDAAVMQQMRAYMATQPKMDVSPEAREAFAGYMATMPGDDTVTIEPATIGGVDGLWCRPRSAVPLAAVLHFHGGAYVAGSAEGYRNFGSRIAAAAGVDLFLPDYALAPEKIFPAALEDAQSVLHSLVAQGTTAIALTGDSAGGGLALALAQHGLHDRAAEAMAVRALVLMSPWTDLTLGAEGLSSREAVDPVLTRAALSASAALYAPRGIDRADPRLSPLFGMTAGMAPVLIHVGSDEILLDDSLSVEKAGEASGSSVEVHVWEGMTHVFPANSEALRAAEEALRMTGAFLRSHLTESKA